MLIAQEIQNASSNTEVVTVAMAAIAMVAVLFDKLLAFLKSAGNRNEPTIGELSVRFTDLERRIGQLERGESRTVTKIQEVRELIIELNQN